MNCPICNAWTTVEDTRNKLVYTLRKRQCANNHVFFTEERIVVKAPCKSKKMKDALK